MNFNGRKWLGNAVIFIAIPAVVGVGVITMKDRQYDVISIILAFLSCMPFYLSFEKKAIKTTELVLIAVMTAIAVVGRFAFAALPGMSPITAIAALTAMYFGPAAGFLTGSLSAVVSNVLFGQGPWTPFQMIAWGLTGYFGGVFAYCGLLAHKWQLALYGLIAGVTFSFVMDIWTVLSIDGTFQWTRYLVALGTAAPFTIIYGISNAAFLVFLRQPIGKRLERIKKKYGL